MTDPVIAMYDALARADREHGGRPWAPLSASDPAYADWRTLGDRFLAGARAWFTNTKVRDLGTIAGQIASAHAKTEWAPTHGVGSPDHIQHVALYAWRPAILALLTTAAAHTAAERARAAEQGRAAA